MSDSNASSNQQAMSLVMMANVVHIDGRPSDGTGEDYAYWCSLCRREYKSMYVTNCSHCGNAELLTFSERKAKLKSKMSELKSSRIQKLFEDDRWKRHQSTLKLVSCPGRKITNYETWEKWVPDSSDDETLTN
jgi:hypothetical protein